MDRAVRVFIEHTEEYVDRAVDRVLAAGVPVYASYPRDVLRGFVAKAFGTVAADVAAGTTEAYPAYLRAIGAQRAKGGTPIAEMISGLNYGFQVVSDHFQEYFGDDLEPRLWWEARKYEIAYAGALAVMDAFYQTREAIIAEQNRQIITLSAPILPLSRGILVMPIVGALEGERASLITEALLQGVARNRSQVVILDVTGMHTVDDGAMDRLLRAAAAARLLGAKIVLVGIRPEAAVALTRRETDLGDVTVHADLTRGFEHALRLRDHSATTERRR